jgi:hypothetical protein
MAAMPDVTIRSFSLEDDRVVVVDVFGGSTSQGLAPPASDLAEDPIGELRREREQRDAVIDSLLPQSSNLSGMPSCLGTTSITSRSVGRPRPVGGRSRNRGRHRLPPRSRPRRAGFSAGRADARGGSRGRQHLRPRPAGLARGRRG